ncbi:MAG TPA: ABC transporter permease, partial [Gemmatimonadales bacterium]
DHELREELRFHREQLERDARGEGVPAEEVRDVARRRLGNLTQVREAARDRWSWPWLDHFFKDLRYALRGLRRSPGFSATVILTLGLGIGANAAMFGVIDRLMFRPFPYLRDPGSVHRVYLTWQDRDRSRTSSAFEYTRYLDLTKFTTSFSQFAGFATRTVAVGLGDASRERSVAVVNASFFDFFEMRPALGRFFVAAEDVTPRGANVVVLEHGFWQREFGGRNVLGETLHVRNIPCVIIGVAPKGFVGVAENEPPAVFLPITTSAGNEPIVRMAESYYKTYNWGWMSVMLRRKPGVSEEAASADLSQAHVRSWNAELALEPRGTPAAIAKPAAVAGSLRTAAGPDAGLEARTLLWVTGVAVIVMLIACANVANLMLARVLRRRREIAVRLALGVSRKRLLAQCLTESLLLAGLGFAAGVVIAQWGGAALRRLFVRNLTTLDVMTDWRTLVVAGSVALVAGVLTGLAPALVAGKGDLAGALKAGAREGGYHRSRMRSSLLVLQAALSVILLVGAGLFVKSLGHVRNLPMGFDAEPLLYATANMRGMPTTEAEQEALGLALLTAGQAIPGVEAAAWVSAAPFQSSSGTNLYVEGIDSVRKLGRFTYQSTTPDFFRTMNTRILRGRSFTAQDRKGTPRVGLVSEAMAQALWPGKDALGQCMRVGNDTVPCTTVIGIAENAVERSFSGEKGFMYYLPIAQYEPGSGYALMLRMRGDPRPHQETVRKVLQAVMPGQSYIRVQPFDEIVDTQRRSWKVGATMFVAFGVLALLVAAVGLYGVITYNVAQRMHELGVRIALGAQAQDVVRLVVGQGVRFALVGVTLGLALALLAAKWIQPLLFNQSARDPATYGMVGGILLLVALLASLLPARRAMRADPNAALRTD